MEGNIGDRTGVGSIVLQKLIRPDVPHLHSTALATLAVSMPMSQCTLQPVVTTVAVAVTAERT